MHALTPAGLGQHLANGLPLSRKPCQGKKVRQIGRLSTGAAARLVSIRRGEGFNIQPRGLIKDAPPLSVPNPPGDLVRNHHDTRHGKQFISPEIRSPTDRSRR